MRVVMLISCSQAEIYVVVHPDTNGALFLAVFFKIVQELVSVAPLQDFERSNRRRRWRQIGRVLKLIFVHLQDDVMISPLLVVSLSGVILAQLGRLISQRDGRVGRDLPTGARSKLSARQGRVYR